MTLHSRLSGMNLEETVEYLADELDIERSERIQEIGRSVAYLQD